MHSIVISLNEQNDVSKLSTITQYDCMFDCEVNCGIENVLCNQIGIPKNYFEGRVQTIFLNGKVLDNCCDDVIINSRDRIALSAAMPGLVGSMLRKKGGLSPMRSSISLNLSGKGHSSKRKVKDLISLKLFNLISKEIGPLLLFSGKIIMDTNKLINMLKMSMIAYPNLVKTLLFDGLKVKKSNKGIDIKAKMKFYKESMIKVVEH